MKPYYFLFGLPLFLVGCYFIITSICELLSQPSDLAVLAGVVAITVFSLALFFLFKFIFNKTKKSNEVSANDKPEVPV